MTLRRILIAAIVLVAVFLGGFAPMWMKLRDQTALRVKAERTLTLMRIVKDLGSAVIDARRGEYESARQETSAFFTAAGYEVDARGQSALSQQQRDALARLMSQRDELITLLARSDARAVDQLSSLYVEVRKIVGV